MNSIIGFTELLTERVKGKKENEFLHAISHNSKQLLRLINDIIDFTQLNKNNLTLKKELVSVCNLIKQLELEIVDIKNFHKKQHLEINFIYPVGNADLILNTDKIRLHQVFVNLIENSIKYTEKGSVEIGYKVFNEKQEVLFYVKDTGIGFPVDNRDLAFKQFIRFHNAGNYEFRGTGLGLALCKHFIDLLGGEIWFDSEPGNGTVFFFTHPYVEEEESILHSGDGTYEINPLDPGFNLPVLKDKVILIVEDDSFSYMMMYYMLEQTKAIILYADSGRKALKIFDQYPVDLVFLDIRLPEMDGYQVIKQLRSAGKNVPVIAQTANALPADKQKIKDAGFDFLITKPISKASLFNVLNKFIPANYPI